MGMKPTANQLVFLEPSKADPQPFTTSDTVAEYSGNSHHAIQQLISKYESDFKDFGVIAFEMRKPLAGSKGGRPEIIYHLNEQQATLLITYLKNTKYVRMFKKELMHQFYEMRRLLLERQSAQWQQARSEGKAARRLETEAIKAFVGYAAANGSKRPEMYYKHFTTMAYTALGIEKGQRNVLPASVLMNLRTVEQVVDRAIREEIAAGTEYHQAFQNAKAKVQQLTALVCAPLPMPARLTGTRHNEN